MHSRCIVLALALGGQLAFAEPAKVVSTIPADGDQSVPVALTNIVIEFDQDMRSGFSVTGGGPAFPKITDKPHWETPRRLIVPVELEPGRDYRFGINSRSARNFRNLAGESTVPVSVAFHTAGEAGSPITNSVAMAEELRRVVTNHYSYRDRVVTNWDARFAEHWSALTNAPTDVAFAEESVKLLSAAKDPHLTVVVENRRLATTFLDRPANVDFRRLPRLVSGWREANRSLCTGLFPDGIGYLLISTWGGSNDDLIPAQTAIDFLRNAKGIVLDLRFNGGGDEDQARTIASRFSSSDIVYAKHRSRDPSAPDGWSAIRERVLRAEADPAHRFTGKVAVLMGPRCMSSNEAFLLMMRATGARLFGERSAGSSGNPKRFDLGNGVQVSVPSWEALDLDGTAIEGRGIDPDEKAAFDPNGEGDPVLEAALRWLRE